MKRRRVRKNNNKPANAIFVADLHLTDSTPVSRTDNYFLAQQNKLTFLQSLSTRNNNCPILCAGDVFDHWKASPWLCSMAYNFLPRPFIGIPGQHDLPGHSIQQYQKSALALIESIDGYVWMLQGGKMEFNNLYIAGVPFGQLEDFDPEALDISPGKRKILLLHELTWKDRKPHWSKGDYTVDELLMEFGEYFDLIITGDNHSGFVKQGEYSTLVNPGSMLRITADQADYQPRCYLYYSDNNEVKPVNIPIEKNVHTREHIDVKKERDERIEAYIEKMNQSWEVGLSFQKNLEAFFRENKTPKKVKEVIQWHLEKTT